MSRKILIAAANPWSLSLAVERQLAREHRSDVVDMVDAYALVSSHSPHWRPRDRAIERINRKIARFLRPVIRGTDITPQVPLDRGKIPPVPHQLGDLQHYRLGSARIGLGVLSSIYELTSIQHGTALPAEYGHVLDEAWTAAHLSHQLGEKVSELRYDRVYIFGGRHSYSRPFCDVLDTTTEVYRYEQGWSGTSYVTAPGSIYEPATLARLIRDLPCDAALGESFYRDRLARSPMSDAGFFTAGQIDGHIPEPLRGKKLITLFTSSVDEMYGLKDAVQFGSFATQYDAAVALADIAAERGMALAVRLHPHLAFKHHSWRSEWNFDRLAGLGVQVIMPDDPADTYALVRASHCVFTCGSTVGFEAAFLGVPNAVIGSWLSAEMGASVRVDTSADLAAFVDRPALPDGAREAALHFGSVQKSGARPIEGLDPGTHPSFARIDGRIVDPVRFTIQRARDVAARLAGRATENRSGIVDGRVLLPSGEQYRKKPAA